MRPTLEQINEKHKVSIDGTTLKNMPFGVLKEIVKDLGLKYVGVKRDVCETNVATFFGITLDAPVAPVVIPDNTEVKETTPETPSIEEEVKSVEHARKSTDFFMLKRFLVKHGRYKPGMNLVECRSASVKLFNDLTGVVPAEKPGNPETKADVAEVVKKEEVVKAAEPVKKVVKKQEPKKAVVKKPVKKAEPKKPAAKVEAPKERKEKVIPKKFDKLQLVAGVKYGHQPNGIIDEDKLKELTLTPEEKVIFEKTDIRDSDKVRELVNIGSKLKIQQIADVLIRSYAMVYEIRKKFILGVNKKAALKYSGKTFKSESAKEIKEIRLKEKDKK